MYVSRAKRLLRLQYNTHGFLRGGSSVIVMSCRPSYDGEAVLTSMMIFSAI